MNLEQLLKEFLEYLEIERNVSHLTIETTNIIWSGFWLFWEVRF